MDAPTILGGNRAAAVDRIAQQVEHPAERSLADRHLNRPTGIDTFLTANQAVGATQRPHTQRTRPPPRCCCTSPVRLSSTPLLFETTLTAL